MAATLLLLCAGGPATPLLAPPSLPLVSGSLNPRTTTAAASELHLDHALPLLLGGSMRTLQLQHHNVKPLKSDDVTEDQSQSPGFTSTFRANGGPSSASRAAAATATMHATVLPGGALELQGASITIVVASTFSAPGPVIHEFNRSLPAGGGGWHVHVHEANGGGTVLGRVTGTCAAYRIERVYFRTGLGMGLIGVNDTIVAGDGELVGVQQRHYASLVDPAVSHVDMVVGPSMYPHLCETSGLDGVPRVGNRAYGPILGEYAGTNGSPSIFASVSSGSKRAGIGLLALDDVMMVHAETANHATFPCNDSSTAPGKELARPWAPAVQLADPHFAIAGGSTHTSEWPVVALGPDCASYWCYINLVRNFTGVTDIEIKGNGPLNAFEESRLVESGNNIAGDFRTWSVETTRRVLRESNLKYFITTIPWTAEQSKCEPTNHKYAHGSAFVHELAPDCEQYIKDLVRVLKSADPDFKVLVYMDAFISSETNGSSKYAADRVLRADLTQQCYGASRPGVGAACCAEWPLFYPFGHHPSDEPNAYAKQLDLYLDKVFELGADGIYHDESSFSISPYTWITDPSRWDGVSAAFNESLHATTKVSNLNLIRQAHHVALMTKAASRGQLAISNAMPQTRTYTQTRLSAGTPLSIHFVETGAQIRGYHTHFFTPWMMNREKAQSSDEDPKYNFTVGDNPGLNVLAHLDYGALSNLCSRLMKNGSSSTVYQRLTPITPVEVGRGYVLGTTKLVTKLNSSVCFSCDGAEALKAWVYDSEGHLTGTQEARGTLQLRLPGQHVAVVEPQATMSVAPSTAGTSTTAAAAGSTRATPKVTSSPAAASACDLSGDWLVNTRVGTGGTLPASNATTAHVVQKADGSYVATSTDPAATGWATQTGHVGANRHVTASCTAGCAAPAKHADCSTAAKCNATCGPTPSGGFHSALCAADGVYYCCQPDSGCNGVHRCPSNKGLAHCACTPSPVPAPVRRRQRQQQKGLVILRPPAVLILRLG